MDATKTCLCARDWLIIVVLYQGELKPPQKGKLKTLHLSRANLGRKRKVLREMKQDKALEEKATKEIASVRR